MNIDATVRVDQHALKPLIAAFSDLAIGVASGRDVSVGPEDRAQTVGESGYVGYEMWVRDLETRAGGIVGASGCFYATRRDLHSETVPEALSRDFAAPLIAREHGFRSVSVREAVCFVSRTTSLRREYHRKVRTMVRGLGTLAYKRHLLNPLRYGRFAWMLVSHKLIRWLVPLAAVAGVVGLGLLSVANPGFRWIGPTAAVGATSAMIAAWRWPATREMPALLAVPGYLMVGMAAGIHAWIKAWRRELNPVWEPTRR